MLHFETNAQFFRTLLLQSHMVRYTQCLNEDSCISGEPWKVVVQTGSEQSTDCESPVVMVMYGDQGNTGDVLLSDGLKIVGGQIDQFEVKVKSGLGDLYKVRVVLDTSNETVWRLDKVRSHVMLS